MISKSFSVTVQYIDDNDKQYNYKIGNLNSQTRVRALRAKVAQVSGKPAFRIVLLYVDQYHDLNDALTLGYYNIKNNSFIIMQVY